MRYEKRIVVCAFMVLIMIISVCAGATSPDEDEAGMMLDLKTLTAETETGTLRAQRVDNSYADLNSIIP